MAICLACNGAGGQQLIDEYDRPENLDCYQCEGTGKVSDQGLENQKTDLLIHMIAGRMTADQEQASQNHEEGWEFFAAEQGISLGEYRADVHCKNAKDVHKALSELPLDILKAIKNQILGTK